MSAPVPITEILLLVGGILSEIKKDVKRIEMRIWVLNLIS